MSRRNKLENKQARRKERLEKPLQSEPTKTISACNYCGEYTVCWYPAKICEECIRLELDAPTSG